MNKGKLLLYGIFSGSLYLLKYYCCCPIIVNIIGAWNLDANVTNIINQKLFLYKTLNIPKIRFYTISLFAFYLMIYKHSEILSSFLALI